MNKNRAPNPNNKAHPSRSREPIPICRPAPSEIRERAATLFAETDDLISAVAEFISDQSIGENADDLLEALAELHELEKRHSAQRLRETKSHKTEIKKIEAIFKGSEMAVKQATIELSIKLGPFLPQNLTTLKPIKRTSKKIDWGKIGPHLTETNIINAARRFTEATGETIEGIEYARVAIV